MNVCVVGRGKVGRALRAVLRQAGVPCRNVASRGDVRVASADVIVIAVRDAHISTVARAISPQLSDRHTVLHTAGARDAEELAVCRTRGAAVAALHPLVSFADPRRPPRIAGATFVFSGDRRALHGARALTRAMDAKLLSSLPVGPSYHAAAAIVANGAAALTQLAVRILCELGATRRPAELAMASLLESVAGNVRAMGLPEALTGPIARGDHATVERHLTALAELDPLFSRDYALVSRLILACAREGALDEQTSDRIERVLKSANRPPKNRPKSPRQRRTTATRVKPPTPRS